MLEDHFGVFFDLIVVGVYEVLRSFVYNIVRREPPPVQFYLPLVDSCYEKDSTCFVVIGNVSKALLVKLDRKTDRIWLTLSCQSLFQSEPVKSFLVFFVVIEDVNEVRQGVVEAESNSNLFHVEIDVVCLVQVVTPEEAPAPSSQQGISFIQIERLLSHNLDVLNPSVTLTAEGSG